MATLDATTASEYSALYNKADRAAAIVSALSGTVTVNIYNGSDVVVGTGTMASPWATVSGDTVVVGDVVGFAVTTSGTPDDDWYLRFVSGSRYVQFAFGLLGSNKEAVWSRSDWTAGTKAGIRNSVITVSGNVAPTFTVAPTTASLGSSGGTIQFVAVDPQGDAVVYSLASRYLSSITINSSTGLVTVPSSAAGTNGNITVTASDGALTATATCAVTVLSAVTGTVIAGSGWEEFSDGEVIWSDTDSGYVGWLPMAYGGTTRGSYSGTASRPIVKTTRSYAGSKSLRFYIPGGDPLGSVGRSEITFQPIGEQNTANYEGVEHFIGFALYLNSDWPTSESLRSVLFQQHIYTGQPGASPIWGLRTAAGTYRLTTETGVGNIDALVASDLAADVGVWRRWVLHVKYSSGSAGWVKIYRDGTLLYDTGNRNTVPPGTTKLGYYKTGNYASLRETRAGAARESYLDALRIANTASGGSLATVDPLSY